MFLKPSIFEWVKKLSLMKCLSLPPCDMFAEPKEVYMTQIIKGSKFVKPSGVLPTIELFIWISSIWDQIELIFLFSALVSCGFGYFYLRNP